MATARVPEPPSDISLLDEPGPLLSAMINDLGTDVNKVKDEVSRYIQPSPSAAGSKSRILKVIAGNTRDNKGSSRSRRSDSSWRTLVKDIPLGRRRRADMYDPDKLDHVPTRMDNSLLVTTKKFLELKNLNDSVNLNDAAEALNVPKRRLYDITNVLEGIDLVEKIGKNSIRWKVNDGDAVLLDALRSECSSLQREDSELDSMLLDLTSAVRITREDPTDKPYGYMQLQDFQSLGAFSDQTLVALKAIREAQFVMELTDPSKTGKYQIKVRTDNSTPLRAVLCPSNSSTYANIEEVLFTDDGPKSAKMARCEASSSFSPEKPLNALKSDGEETKPPIIDASSSVNDIVLPECNSRRDPLSDLITPDKNVFHNTANYPSPLKMLLEPYNQPSSSNDSETTHSLLTPRATDPDPYSFPSSSFCINDLFSSSEWEFS
ncbi:hypothetical protein Q1695_001106 [Nippostrongylus brasiliensis]|nr:hypothetical protein Q1695_001106 [Nippostrongylus brasiliensis]